MEKKKRRLINNLKLTIRIISTIVDEIERLGGDEHDIRRVLKDVDLCTKIAKEIINPGISIAGSYRVNIDHSIDYGKIFAGRTYDQLLKYHHISDIRSCEGDTEVTLFRTLGCFTADQIVVAMKREGFVPAEIDVAFAFGASFSATQEISSFICLGTTYTDCHDADDTKCVPYIFYQNSKCVLASTTLEGRWKAGTYFLAVRK